MICCTIPGIQEKGLSLLKGPFLGFDPYADWCSGRDELEPVICWCAMLQAAEYPRHNIVLPICFKSDSLKNILEYVEPMREPMTFKACFVFI